MPTYGGGRHEHGQNFLNDHTTIGLVIDLVSRTQGPIIEIGPGGGALTFGLQDLRRPLTAVEIDTKQIRRLRPRVASHVHLVHGDFLRWRLPGEPHVLVGNLPFHLTTAMMRKVLHAPGWTVALLLVQWEVARRRAGVGGASMMTAQWWPWVDFAVEARVPSAAFTPAPSVDAGLLRMSRRSEPLLAPKERRTYRGFVHTVFTGRGKGLPAILAPVVGPRARKAVQSWSARERVGPTTLPKDLSARQWADLYSLARRNGWKETAHGARTRKR